MSEIGHNRGDSYRAHVAELRGFIERIERLQDEMALIAEQIRDVKAEAKASGYDTRAMTEVLRLRRKDRTKASEEEAMRAFYIDLMGIFA